MAWVVDTCLLIDVLEDDPQFGASSAALLDAHRSEGLALCPMSYTELSPAFEGSRAFEEEFLEGVGVAYRDPWDWEDTLAAHAAWSVYVTKKRAGLAQKRPLADILIGAYATRRQGLLTRNAADFVPYFPDLVLRDGL